MSSFYPPKIAARPAPTAAGADLHCRKCRAPLIGLTGDQACPACGLSVALSMRGTELRYSDPAFVSRLQLGALLDLVSTFVVLIGLAAGAANAASRTNANDPIMDVRIPIGILLGGCLLSAIGTWLLTTPDPGGLGERSYGGSRNMTRVMFTTGVLAAVLLMGGMIVRPSMGRHWEFKLAAELVELIGWAGSVTLLDYLSGLAMRIRDTRISERAHLLRNGWAATCGLIILCSVSRDFILPTQFAIDNDLGGLFLSLYAIAGLTGFVIWVLWSVLLMKLGTRLKEQARLARTMWQAVA